MHIRSIDKETVLGLIVTYRPDRKKLATVLEALRGQIDRVLVVDNGSGRGFVEWLHEGFERVDVLAFDENRGLGAAQNAGIKLAKKRGFSHVLFLDQDSVPGNRMVEKLLSASKYLENGEPIAAVGPVIVDSRNGADSPFVLFGFPSIRRNRCVPGGEKYPPADFLISSGMMVRTEIFDRVGLIDESLFIDNLDLEWCFRAKSMGFALRGVCGAHLSHSLGDEVVRIGKIATVHRHSPLRQYYIMRNRIILYGKRHSPFCWIVHDVIRMLLKTVFLLLFFPKKANNIRMIFHGMTDGLRSIVNCQPRANHERS